MENVQRIARKRSLWRGLLNSSTQIIPGIAYGFALYVGGYMIANKETDVKSVIRFVTKCDDKQIYANKHQNHFCHF